MKIIATLITILYFLHFNQANAFDHDKITVKNINNGVKISFFGKKKLDFTIENKDSIIIVNFKEKFKPNNLELLTQNNTIIQNVHIINDYSIVFELIDNSYSAIKFISDSFSGMNIGKKPPSVSNSNPANNSSELKPLAYNIPNGKAMVFPWQQNVAAAVFYRAGYLWIIFNNSQLINLDNIKSVFNQEISEFHILTNRDYTILRFKGTNLKNIKVLKKDYNWTIQILQNSQIAIPKKEIVQYKSPYSKGIFFPVEDITQSPIAIIDPKIGDKLQIVLSYNSDTGVAKIRNFIDFIIQPSAQGFVVQQLSDSVKVNIIIPGIEILTATNSISAHALQNNPPNMNQTVHVYSFLPFDKWHNLSINDFNIMKKKLEDNILTSNEEGKNEIRLELAKLLLGNGFYYEALGMLNYMTMTDPNIINNDLIKCLKGVTEFAIGRYHDALENFNAVNKDFMKEEDRLEFSFWQNALDLKQNKTVADYNFIRFKDRFLKTYPPKLYYQFAYLDLVQSLDLNDLDHADEIFKLLRQKEAKKNNTLSSYTNSNLYYFGLYLLKNNTDPKVAVRIWDTLENNVNDPFNRSRAMFASAKNLYEFKVTNIDDTINKLNQARFIWRGDEIEYEITQYLTHLYLINHDYVNALRSLKTLVSHFSDSNNHLELTAKMGKIFFQIFGPDGEASKLDNLKSIALFYEFRALTPIGEMGDQVIQGLIIKLINLDLLKRASALLSHQVNFRLNGIARLKAANRLVKLYIVDKDPDKALSALDATEDQSMTLDIKIERQHLKAQALLDLNQPESALKALEGEDSIDADYLRANIAWYQNNWNQTISIIEPLLTKKISQNQKFSEADSFYLLKLLLAYIKLENLPGAHHAYNNFINYLDNSNAKIKDTIDFVAKADKNIDYRDLETSLDLKHMTGFIEQYKKDLLAPNI